MNSNLDPDLQRLFDSKVEDLDADRFTASVMAGIDSSRRASVIAWAAIALAFVASAWLLSEPVIGAVGVTTQLLPATLVDIDNEWLSQLLSPINSVAAVVALLVLGVRAAWRKIF